MIALYEFACLERKKHLKKVLTFVEEGPSLLPFRVSVAFLPKQLTLFHIPRLRHTSRFSVVNAHKGDPHAHQKSRKTVPLRSYACHAIRVLFGAR